MINLIQITFIVLVISCTSKNQEFPANLVNQKLKVNTQNDFPDTVILAVNKQNIPIEIKVILSDSTHKILNFDRNYLVKVRETNFTNGKLDGLATEWTETGLLFIQRNFKNGRKVGKEEYYYFTGEKNGLLNYNENGNLDGEILWWYKNGNLETKILIDDGLRNDKSYSYRYDGTLECIYYYKEDTLFKQETYENGLLINTEFLNKYDPY